MSAKVLITGGLGYFGGRIATAFAQSGQFDLVLGTRHLRETRPAWAGQAQIIAMDFNTPASLDRACAGAEYVIHLAALNEIESVDNPQLAVTVNTLGTLQILQAAERARVRRFIYFSTAHVYGAPLAGHIDECTLPQPVHPYAITHRAAEDLVLAAHAQGRIEGTALRVSNGFGAPADISVNRWTLLANDLCRQAVRERQLVLNSPGLQIRDFVTLHDVARATLHVAGMPAAALGNGLFNVGGAAPMRVCDLAERIGLRCERTLGFKPPLNRPAIGNAKPAPALDYSIEKLKATGFALTGDMDSELDATLRLCSEAYGNQQVNA
jgi:UDP-glucose 4-epimerase